MPPLFSPGENEREVPVPDTGQGPDKGPVGQHVLLLLRLLAPPPSQSSVVVAAAAF